MMALSSCTHHDTWHISCENSLSKKAFVADEDVNLIWSLLLAPLNLLTLATYIVITYSIFKPAQWLTYDTKSGGGRGSSHVGRGSIRTLQPQGWQPKKR